MHSTKPDLVHILISATSTLSCVCVCVGAGLRHIWSLHKTLMP